MQAGKFQNLFTIQAQHNTFSQYYYSLQNMLKKEPDYIISDPHVYSIQDLINIKFGMLYDKLQDLVQVCCAHAMECEVLYIIINIIIITSII